MIHSSRCTSGSGKPERQFLQTCLMAEYVSAYSSFAANFADLVKWSISRERGPVHGGAALGCAALEATRSAATLGGDGLGGDGSAATGAEATGSEATAAGAFFFSIAGSVRTPKKFADYLDGKEPAKVYLRAADCGPRLWTVEVLFDGQGRMYLDKGWEKFAIAHGVDFGWFVHFKYEGDDVLTVKVFDGTMCRRYYYSDDEDTDDESDDDVKPCIHPL
ncbi:hypothetical protein QYE76_005112 [Lolium multiflorum]|uniref:TF-B3 domain-containing protein n=1 Tax=Lolium multiflorum TaxID=4521 RepID=A0AAD8W0V0_LOLMU|nr:hypothetical protein QYE76_005112 [Lolium multiflorum]